jgi:DNA-binding XRE family transcriptional regulator
MDYNDFKDYIQRIKDRIDPIQFIEDVFCTPLKKRGAIFYGLCYFHNEKTPSMAVHPSGMYYCHSCNAKGGDIIAFTAAALQCTTWEAICYLGEKLGVNKEDTTRTTAYNVFVKESIKQIETGEYLPHDLIKQKLCNSFENNNLGAYIASKFGEKIAHEVIQMYGLGTAKNVHGFVNACIFWYVDAQQRISYGKIMSYDRVTGRRNKSLAPQSVHHLWNKTKPPHSFFGLQLLLSPVHQNKKIFIVESEKTAMCMAALSIKEGMNDGIWMATGGKSQLKLSNLAQLAGRTCILYPDKDGYEVWKVVCEDARKKGYKVFLSDIIKNANIPDKSDIWDFANI